MAEPSAAVDSRTQAFREWIAAILHRTGLKPTQLAKVAGLSHSTLSRALNDDDYRINFRADTIAKLAQVGGISPPAGVALGAPPAAPGATPGQPSGFCEPDASPALSRDGRELTVTQSIWTARTGALAPLGLMAGDHFILDQAVAPRLRDIVMVQQYDNTTGTAESHLRVWADGFAVSPLYLVDGTPRIYIDGINAQLMGVVVESWRTRPQ
jgi:transcriptional regulator with XRE-family HTH domain